MPRRARDDGDGSETAKLFDAHQAAATVVRNLSTSIFRWLLSLDKD